MDRTTYTLAAQVEDCHWWFKGRRAILRSVLRRYLPGADGNRTILEVGCGNGGNLPLLSCYGKVFAVEMDDEARMRAVQRGMARVEKGWLPDSIPFGRDRFNVIAALDVIEHIEDDQKTILALSERLVPEGLLILTVPAYQWLWNQHDDLSHHKRRYTYSQIVALVQASKMQVLYCSYFNTILFPIAATYLKIVHRITASSQSSMRIPPRWLNCLLGGIFSTESLLIPSLQFPFGISIILCARAAAR